MIQDQNCHYKEHGLELIQSYPGNKCKFDFNNFLISWKYRKSSFSSFSYPGNIGNLSFPSFYCLGNIWQTYFSYLLIISKTFFNGGSGRSVGCRGQRSHGGVRGAEPPGGRAASIRFMIEHRNLNT